MFLVLVKLINPCFGNSPYCKSLLHFELKSIYYVELQTELKVQGFKSGLGFLSVSLSVDIAEAFCKLTSKKIISLKLVNIDPLSYVKAS